MRFVGQSHIMKQLAFLLPDLYENKSRSANFLLRGPSGYGKTTMAVSICNYLSGNNFQVFWGDWTEWEFRKRVVFLDEVHKVKDHEKLYPVMDSGEHVLVFATNHDGILPEAFSNRCTEFVFAEYSEEELLHIARNYSGFQATRESFLEIIEAGNRNPRIIERLCKKMHTYLSRNNISSMEANFREILKEVFSIEDGLDTLCREYLQRLQGVGGTASLSLIKSLLHVDEATLTYNVEPILLRKGLISITRKGRSLTNAFIQA